MSEVAEKANINYQSLTGRIRAGMSVEDVISKPRARLFTVNGETMTSTELAREYEKSVRTVNSRIEKGWSIEDALDVVKYRSIIDGF